MKKILLAMLACAGLCACSSDDIDLTGGDNAVFEGDKAYIAVRIADVGSTTRATSSGLTNGSAAEYAVGNAYFYFYDSEGTFVSEGEVWDGATGEDAPNTSIDFTSAKTIILKGLTQRSYPKYVVTVLNKPTDFTPADDIRELIKELASESTVGIKDDNGNFVMSTTSFADQKDEDNGQLPYFVTELKTSDFHLEPIVNFDDSIPVDIYVERLAAKVTVDVADALKSGDGVITENGNTYYPIEETVAGDLNSDEADQDDIGAEQFYINILGWKLNGTARKSNILKNIDETWTDTYLNFTTWNDPTNHRSYWGESFNYNKIPAAGAYPEYSDGNKPEDEADESEWLNEYVKYVNLEDDNDNNSPLLALGKDDYCAENTNTAANTNEAAGSNVGTNNHIVIHKNSSAITSVLLKAQICHRNADDTGWEYPTLVRYDGVLYTEDEYEDYVLNLLTIRGNINAYYSTDGENFTRIDHNYVTISDMNDIEAYENETGIDGYYGIELNTTEMQKVNWYTRSSVDENGNYTYSLTQINSISGTISSALQTFNLTAEANGYVNGLMYYNIPIEHLNNEYIEEKNVETGKLDVTVNEANYGVVRNHWYKVTINELSNLGKGITDEEEVIIPEPDEQETYYVGAEINILSWKLVEQGVSL